MGVHIAVQSTAEIAVLFFARLAICGGREIVIEIFGPGRAHSRMSFMALPRGVATSQSGGAV